MTRKLISLVLAVLVCCFVGQNAAAKEIGASDMSGKVVGGLRLLTIVPEQTNDFIVYRGDYIQPSLEGQNRFIMAIPELKVEKTFPVNEGEQAYVKMKEPGIYRFTAGEVNGTIRVIEYTASSYIELSAGQADKILRNTSPLILDVRTQGEFQRGYIQGAKLLPVQVLQQYLHTLERYKNQDVFIYCATGNRSTVASRILIESGFKRIYNLRYGIADWEKRGYPVIQ